MIVKVTDSFGNQFYSTQIQRNSTGRGLCDTRTTGSTVVFPNDTLTIHVEIDPSFDEKEYSVSWIFDKKESSFFQEEKNSLVLKIENQHIRTDFAIYCSLKSNEEWRRC